MTNTLQSQPPVRWKQVLGLAAIQSAIALMWVVYGSYLPQLLAQFGLPPQIAGVLLVVENGLAAVLEPVMGGLSDRTRRWSGTRFPFISAGAILASALFIAIPSLGILASPGAVMRQVVLFVLVAWSIAMTTFRSPVLSLLQRYASIRQLPLAASLLSLASGLIGTTQPIVSQTILNFGPAVAFAIGSIVLLAAVAALRSIDPPEDPPALLTPVAPPLPYMTLGLIAAVGMSIGLGVRLLMGTFGRVLTAEFPDLDVGKAMFVISLGLAILSIPVGWMASRVGNQRMLASSLLVAVCCCGVLLLSVPLGVVLAIVVLVVSLSCIFNSAIPFALGNVPASAAGVGVGTYFGGSAVAVCIFNLVFPQLDQLTLTAAIVMGAIAFSIALFCVTVVLKPAVTDQTTKA